MWKKIIIPILIIILLILLIIFIRWSIRFIFWSDNSCQQRYNLDYYQKSVIWVNKFGNKLRASLWSGELIPFPNICVKVQVLRPFDQFIYLLFKLFGIHVQAINFIQSLFLKLLLFVKTFIHSLSWVHLGILTFLMLFSCWILMACCFFFIAWLPKKSLQPLESGLYEIKVTILSFLMYFSLRISFLWW